MYVASDSIHIDAAPEEVFRFFRDLDGERYLEWHPDHLGFRWIEGDALEEGSVCRFREEIGGRPFAVTVESTAFEPPGYIEFRPTNPFWRVVYPKSTMEFSERDGGCIYTSRNCFRVGPLRRLGFVQRRLELVEEHMQEEDENLKEWVEDGK